MIKITIKQRFLQFAKYKGLTQAEFCQKLEVSVSSFKGNHINEAISSDAIDRFITIFPEINLEWLLTGNGTMLKEEKVYDVGLEVLAKERCENCNTLERLIKNQDERIKELKDTIEILKKK